MVTLALHAPRECSLSGLLGSAFRGGRVRVGLEVPILHVRPCGLPCTLTSPALCLYTLRMSSLPAEPPAAIYQPWDAGVATWPPTAFLGGQAAPDWAIRLDQASIEGYCTFFLQTK